LQDWVAAFPTAYREHFDAETAAVADALMAGTQADAEGLAQVQDAPGDPRFAAPLSGWYWQIASDGQVFATSDSLYQAQLDGSGNGPDGAALRLTRRDFTVPGSPEALSLTVTAPQAEINAALSTVRRPLAWTLVALGLGLGLAVLVQVTWGLSALKTMGRDLRAVRAGEATTLPLPDAAELRPVAQEVNALLVQNRDQLARTREQIGNLAHSLKTPLMALQGEMAPGDAGQAMIARMDRQIAWHLKRAGCWGNARRWRRSWTISRWCCAGRWKTAASRWNWICPPAQRCRWNSRTPRKCWAI